MKSYIPKHSLIIIFVIFFIQNGIAQSSQQQADTIKSKQQKKELTKTVPTTQKILEKYKIDLIEIASLERLQDALEETTKVIKGIPIEEERSPFIILKSELKNQIMVLKAEEESRKAEEKFMKSHDESTKIGNESSKSMD